MIRPEDLATPAPAPSRAREIAGTALGWIIGVLIGVAGLGVMMTDVLGGFLFLVTAAVVLPPVNTWLKGTLSVVLSAKAKAWLVVGLLFARSLAMGRKLAREDDRERDTAATARFEALRADYRAHSPAILHRMDSAFRARDYPLAVSIGEKYVGVALDSQLVRRLSEAQAAQRRVADRAKEQQLVARLQRTPATDLETNRTLYQQLAALNPANASYKAKYDDFNARTHKRDAADQDRIRRFGPMPQASAWHGTYSEVKDYLRQVANDPDRLKMDACTPVYHVTNGWLVGCDYRGANAFGGIIRQSNWFIIRQGRVVEMKDASAYRP